MTYWKQLYEVHFNNRKNFSLNTKIKATNEELLTEENIIELAIKEINKEISIDLTNYMTKIDALVLIENFETLDFKIATSILKEEAIITEFPEFETRPPRNFYWTSLDDIFEELKIKEDEMELSTVEDFVDMFGFLTEEEQKELL
jgi:hypothetical protein